MEKKFAKLKSRTVKIMTSIVWTWFGYGKSDQEQAKLVCKICRQLVPARTGNTANLFHHLRRHHPSNYTESVTLRAQTGTTPHTQPSKTTKSPVSIASGSGSVKQQSIQLCFTAIAPYEKQSKWSKNITSTITYCLTKDMMPLSTVEKDQGEQGDAAIAAVSSTLKISM